MNPSLWSNMVYGFAFFLPIYATVFIVGGFWEVLFASVRKHEVNEGSLSHRFLFTDLPTGSAIVAGGLGHHLRRGGW
jgi:Na+-transporting NADH:ubiquinone oxidoreductase subunit NqrB